MALPPKKEVFLDHTAIGDDASVLAFLAKNDTHMRKFFMSYFKKLDYPLLLDTLKTGEKLQVQQARDFISDCFECRQDKIPYDKIRFPIFLERKIARLEGKTGLWGKVKETGRNLRDKKIGRALFKNLPEIYALGLSRMGMTVGERQALLANIALPVLQPYLIGGFVSSFMVAASPANAALPEPDMKERLAERTPLEISITAPRQESPIHAYVSPSEGFKDVVSSILTQPASSHAFALHNIHPYYPLLDLIKSKEANNNCNIAFGGEEYDLTKMSLRSVRELQDKLVEEGSPSSAMGCYQIIRSTMDETSKRLKLTGDEIFDEALQEKMAVALLKKRGVDSYLSGNLPLKEFVTELAKEWASLPKDEGGKSYYDGDGLNKALVPYARVVEAIDSTLAIKSIIKTNHTVKFNHQPSAGKG